MHQVYNSEVCVFWHCQIERKSAQTILASVPLKQEIADLYVDKKVPQTSVYTPTLDKAPRLSISIVIWILSSDTICQLNQFNKNSEVAMLSTPPLQKGNAVWTDHFSKRCFPYH